MPVLLADSLAALGCATGNCSPRFVRMTTNNIAIDQELIDTTKLCVGAIIQPLADQAPGEVSCVLCLLPVLPLSLSNALFDAQDPIRLVDHGPSPLRCRGCRVGCEIDSTLRFGTDY